MDTLQPLVDQWMLFDQDKATRDEIQHLVDNGDHVELEKRLRTRIAFGTAGLRARMEAGFARMNSLTVIQTSQGLASYLLDTVPRAKQRGIVIGHDARFNSARFANVTAAAFATAGFRVLRFKGVVHTPLVPFAVDHLYAAAGIMITASHNPAQDNGYKVYWSNGCQIIPPHDAGIAAAIQQNLEPRSWSLKNPTEKQLVETIQPEIWSLYHEKIRSIVSFRSLSTLPKFVYTPLHGVGLESFLACFSFLSGLTTTKMLDHRTTLGERQVEVVLEQSIPDPNFPTVKFPNPEEKGALDLAIQTANVENTDLIIATDPDADRFAAAEKKQNGQWHQFSGNEVGVLLASHILESQYQYLRTRNNMTMLCSTVSTGMLKRMAELEGFNFVETLTGFKWLGNVAQQLVKEQGKEVPFAFEEALGYMFPSVVHDKDGISASAVFLDAASRWKSKYNATPFERLQQLYQKYGFFADANTYLISPSADVTKAVFSDIRNSSGNEPGQPPTQLEGRQILRWRDLTLGFDTGTQDGVPDLPVDSSSEMITCEIEGQTRFTVRASGTEPKIKLYIESRAETAEAAKLKALATQHALVHGWFQPGKYNLVPA